MSDVYFEIVSSIPYTIFAVIVIIIAIIAFVLCISADSPIGAFGCIIGAMIILAIIPLLIMASGIIILVILFGIVNIFTKD